MYIGDERIEPTDLAELEAEDAARIVYVRGDQTISYAQLMEVLSIVNHAGFAKVPLIAEAAGPK
jgi:biopolymer transport protein ExbD